MLKLSNGTMSNDSKGSRKSSEEVEKPVIENEQPVTVEVDDLEVLPGARSTIIINDNEPEVDQKTGNFSTHPHVFSFANNGQQEQAEPEKEEEPQLPENHPQLVSLLSLEQQLHEQNSSIIMNMLA